MGRLENLVARYGAGMVFTGAAVFEALGFTENFIGDEVVLVFLPHLGKGRKCKEFRRLRLKTGNKFFKVDGVKVFDPCATFAYMCKKNYPEETLLKFFMELRMKKYSYKQIFEHVTKHTFRKYPDLKRLRGDFKSVAEVKLWRKMNELHLPRTLVNPAIPMTYAEKKLLGIQSTYSRVKPDFFWPRERVAIEYQGGYHGEGETFLRDCDKDNFYASRGITVLKITKQNWDGALRFVQGLLFKRRGWKTKHITQKLPPLFSFV